VTLPSAAACGACFSGSGIDTRSFHHVRAASASSLGLTIIPGTRSLPVTCSRTSATVASSSTPSSVAMPIVVPTGIGVGSSRYPVVGRTCVSLIRLPSASPR